MHLHLAHPTDDSARHGSRMRRDRRERASAAPGLLLVISAAATLGSCCTAASGQVEITLRSSARIEPDAKVTLGAIAELTGPDASRWRDLTLDVTLAPTREDADDGDRGSGHQDSPNEGPPRASAADSADADWKSVTIDDVRRAIESQPNVHWGKIVLRGSSCAVRRVRPTSIAVPIRPADRENRSDGPIGPTIRSLIESRLAALFDVDDSRIRFEFAADDDRALEAAVDGRIVELQPVGKSDRVSVTARVFDGDRLVMEDKFRVGVEIRRDVVVVGASLRRGEAITDQVAQIESRWMPATSRPASIDGAMGSVARTRLAPGTVVMSADVEEPIVVERGDLVAVDCLAGSVSLRRTLRATASARDGEMVTLQALDSRKTFRARMNGKGRAVMVIGGAPTIETAGYPDTPVGSHPTGGDSADGTGGQDLPARAGDPAGSATPDESSNVIRVGGIEIVRKAPLSGGSAPDSRSGKSARGSAQSRREGDRVERYSRLADRAIDAGESPAEKSRHESGRTGSR
jgi:flagella basal body P-ring formation protein FlgA